MSNQNLAQILTASAVVFTIRGNEMPAEASAVIALQCAVHRLVSNLLEEGYSMREVLKIVAPDVELPPLAGEGQEGFSE